MPKKSLNQPTKAELRILQVLWRHGPSTVRRVYEGLGEASGYTSVLKLMQIMLEKGLLSRDAQDRTHVYTATVPETEAKRGLVQDLIEKAFGGSSKELIVQALSTKRASAEELLEIKRMIEEMEGKNS
jgi:BlaI family transcriptional regulator, penicillinase repressor